MANKEIDGKEIIAVGFDVDKTLYKPSAAIDEKIREYICRKACVLLNKEYSVFRPEFDEKYSQMQSAKKSLKYFGIEGAEDIVQEGLENADIASALVQDKRLAEMMMDLFYKYKLFLITGSNNDQTRKKLEALGLRPAFFRESITSDNKGYRREDSTAFKYIAGKLRVNYENMMFVGDRENIDIIPAANLGITTAIVNAKSDKAAYQLEEIYDLEKILLKK